MIGIERIIAGAIVLGIIAFAIGIRIYGAYAAVRESRRGDVGVESDMQTLFTNPTEAPTHNNDEIQTLFEKEN